jgi:hypothetical protein
VKNEVTYSSRVFSLFLQDNVYVTIVTCVQYRALADKASHAFYTLINTRSQIQAHVFDGNYFLNCYYGDFRL